MAKYCRQCGEKMDDNAKFCGMCATPFDDKPKGDPGKKKMIMKVALLALAVLFIVLLVTKCAGGGSVESKLVGTWYFGKNDSYAFTLYDDGTCKIDGEYGTGTWAVVNKNKLKLTNIYGQSEVAEIEKLTGSKLILRSGNKTQTLIKKG